MTSFKIRRAGYEIEIKALGKLKPVVVGDDVAAIFARGLLHYDKEIGAVAVEKKGSGKDAKLVDKAWTAEGQAAIELRMEALLGVVFEGVEIAATKRVKASKVDVGAAISEAMRSAKLDEAAIKAAVEAQGFAYSAPVAAQPELPAVEQGVEMA